MPARTHVLLAPVMVIVGVSLGYLIMLLSWALGGAGHGWDAASVSITSLVGAPLAFLGWIYRRNPAGRILFICALIVALGTDAVLARQTASEGFSQVARVWRAGPEWVLVWAALFFGWQILAVAALSLRAEK